MYAPTWKCSTGGSGAVGFLLCVLPAALSAQVLQGHVVDAESEQPVPSAFVTLLSADSVAVDAAMADSAGFFSVAGAVAGEYRLVARRIGYPATISSGLRVRRGDTIRVQFRISAGAVLLDPVVVTSRRRPPPPDIRDFYARAERAIYGNFMTRAQIEDAHAFRASDLLRRIPGVQVLPARYGASAVKIRGCDPHLIVDGVLARYERSIDNLVAPLELEGLEIYRSASQVPVQYGGLRGDCGAILIWTRRGQ